MKEKQPLYDYSIEYDITNLPKSLKYLIRKMEEYDKTGDWVCYDSMFDVFEVDAKSYLLKGRITEKDYKILIRKYGWLSD